MKNSTKANLVKLQLTSMLAIAEQAETQEELDQYIDASIDMVATMLPTVGEMYKTLIRNFIYVAVENKEDIIVAIDVLTKLFSAFDDSMKGFEADFMESPDVAETIQNSMLEVEAAASKLQKRFTGQAEEKGKPDLRVVDTDFDLELEVGVDGTRRVTEGEKVWMTATSEEQSDEELFELARISRMMHNNPELAEKIVSKAKKAAGEE